MRHGQTKYLLTAIALVVSTVAPAALAIPTDGLVAWWPFDGNANDASGNGHHGTVYGATLAQDRLGNSSGAYSFAGHEYISVPDSDELTLASDFTMGAWTRVNAYSPDGVYYLMGHSEGPGLTSKWIFALRSNGISFVVSPGPGWIPLGDYPFDLDTWYGVAIRRSGNDLTAFVDGALVGTVALTSAAPDPSASLLIGTAEFDRPNRQFRGQIDDVVLYSRALSDDEIQTLYGGSPSTIPAPGAMLLGTIGAGLLSWLRRRRMV